MAQGDFNALQKVWSLTFLSKNEKYKIYTTVVISRLLYGLQVAWLGICVYTWVGPGLFARYLKRELDSVALKPDF